MSASQPTTILRSKWAWFVLVLVQFVSLTWLAGLGEIPVVSLWVGYGTAFAAYVLAIGILRRERIPLAVVFLVALALRLPWVPAGLSLSDDAWRYLHDGRSQVAGVNPYRYPPAAPEARWYAGPEHSLINNAELPTIYPPAAQLAFRVAVHLGGTLVVWKVLLVVADLLIGAVLAGLLIRRGRDPCLSATYLLHPLVVVEFAGNAHLDALGILALLLSLLLLQRNTFVSGAALALSGAVKYLAFPLVPFLVRAAGRRGWILAVGVGVTLVMLYLPFIDDVPLGSLGTFARTFEFNGPIYLLAYELVGKLEARVILAVMIAGLLLYAWVKRIGIEDVVVLWIGAVLFVSPIVHPWYLTWLIPFFAWRRENWALVWTGTVVLSYYVLTDWRTDGIWHLPAEVMLVEYLPVYILVGFRLAGVAGKGAD